MDDQRIARIAGVLFIITFITSIPAQLVFYDAVLNDADYITGAGSDSSVALGALLELFLIIANIGTAVVLFPVLRRTNEGLALGYVTARIVESFFIAVGILSVLTIMALRQEAADADGARLSRTDARSDRTARRQARGAANRGEGGDRPRAWRQPRHRRPR